MFHFKHFMMSIILGFVLTLVLPASGLPFQVMDDMGQTLEFAQPAKRIIPLYGAYAEMLYAIGAGSEIVARTQADEYPSQILKLPSVGTHMRPNVEMILGLKPDLVIQSASRREETAEMERLREAGIPVAVFAPQTFEGIFSTMERLGKLTGREAEARNVVAQLKMRLEQVKGHLAEMKERDRVFFEVRGEPLTGVGKASIVQDIILAAGAENALENEKAIVQYSFESLLLADPDVYIVQRGPMNRNPMDPRKRAHFDRLRCVRNGKIIFVDEFLFSRPGPRCVDAVEQLAAALYPEKFKGWRNEKETRE
ncbi:ABC transporter substrate-binding protein [Desulforhabdus amnigena]|jgi:iron complex transport system substrate-binding protein|uniref:Iron ABC transporter substrate-binding protein n=1 Tax=Desulforhabdus amnigena TaxID=40218 RepID=A0A9W6FUF8_9BACT|nr:helical backbone metal receptor [Desulforhabdus amnigena]GLI35096.1 iron ABC transporter substrate-binding protein [Desulforhabdus amnigena]